MRILPEILDVLFLPSEVWIANQTMQDCSCSVPCKDIEKIAHPCNKRQKHVPRLRAKSLGGERLRLWMVISDVSNGKVICHSSVVDVVFFFFFGTTSNALVVPALIMPVRHVLPRPRRRGRIS